MHWRDKIQSLVFIPSSFSDKLHFSPSFHSGKGRHFNSLNKYCCEAWGTLIKGSWSEKAKKEERRGGILNMNIAVVTSPNDINKCKWYKKPRSGNKSFSREIQLRSRRYFAKKEGTEIEQSSIAVDVQWRELPLIRLASTCEWLLIETTRFYCALPFRFERGLLCTHCGIDHGLCRSFLPFIFSQELTKKILWTTQKILF
jgi:hypothetical protein